RASSKPAVRVEVTMADSKRQSEAADIVIAGGGHVGLGLALALRRASSRLAVTVVDATPPDAPRDRRASAIAAAGRRMLDKLGVWTEIEDEAEPIREMIVTDSRTGDAARPVFLTFDGMAK